MTNKKVFDIGITLLFLVATILWQLWLYFTSYHFGYSFLLDFIYGLFAIYCALRKNYTLFFIGCILSILTVILMHYLGYA